MIGTSLLHYEITGKIGEGGMGVVWRARDTSLDREAAIKVLPAALAHDEERLARFEREAKLLASLNHPNIASVYGLHEASGQRFIAMELVGGEDLSDRLARGAIPAEEAIEIALHIAEALEAAHANGIVHRDLKPANVRLTPDGGVKVLDFGLAKAFDLDPGGDSASMSLSPTLTARHTVEGIILGTAAYMAPEQARGKSVDRRADLWAFGVILYEMLTGRRLFEGETVSDVLAGVLKTEPDLEALPAGSPASVRRLLSWCLRRNPRDRLHDAADARILLEDVIAGHDDLDRRETSSAAGGKPLRLIGAAVLGLITGALLWALLGPKETSPAPAEIGVRRSQIPLPDGTTLNWGLPIAISSDGTTLALSIELATGPKIHVRRLDSTEMVPLEGSEGGWSPFFSPAGDQVGFFADGELRTASLEGGGQGIRVLCDAPEANGAAWDVHGWIYFIYGESRLARVSENGGKPEHLGEAGNVPHVTALPEGRGMLITRYPADAPSHRKDEATLAVLLPDGKETKPILEGGYDARYLPDGPSDGYILFMRTGGLFAIPFDLERLETSGRAVGVQPNVFTDSIWAGARYDVSADGTLVYVSGGDHARTIPTWVDLASGNEEPLAIPAGIYNTFDLSPDGTQLAIQDASGGEDQIYVYDGRRGNFSRLTLEGANMYPVWSADGREVFFSSNRSGRYRLYRQPVDGSAPASRLLTEEQGELLETDARHPSSVTPDGQFLLLFTFAHPTRGGDIWKVALDGSGRLEQVLATEANEIIPQISPDGRWLAYLSDRAGSYQTMVRPFPEVDRREWMASGAGGFDPRWSHDGRELIYRSGWQGLMSVPVGGGEEIIPGVPKRLLDIDFHDSAGSSFAVSPDGKRILVNRPVNASLLDTTPLTLVTGWVEEVRRMLASQ